MLGRFKTFTDLRNVKLLARIIFFFIILSGPSKLKLPGETRIVYRFLAIDVPSRGPEFSGPFPDG